MSTRPSYLASIAHKVYQTHASHLEQCCLVFPTAQAGYVFRQHLAKKFTKPTWGPTIYRLPQLMQALDPASIPSHLTLLSHLYHIVQRITHQKQLSFAHFSTWGTTLLQDLDNAAHHLIPLELLFATEPSPKALSQLTPTCQKMVASFWDTFASSSSPMQAEWLALWRYMPAICQAFHQHLERHQITYAGLHYQQVCTKLTQKKIFPPYKALICIGLQPLTPIVQKILTAIACCIPVESYYDTDAYYMTTKPTHSAGSHLRSYANHPVLGKFLKEPFESMLETNQSSIIVTASSTQVGQVHIIAQQLQKLRQETTFLPQKAAIILPDPSLLVPLLHALPAGLLLDIHVDYPLGQTPLYGLLLDLLKFHFHHAFDQTRHHIMAQQAFDKLLKHPYLRLSEDQTQSLLAAYRRTSHQIHTVNGLSSLWRCILTSPTTYPNLWSYIIDLLKLLTCITPIGKPLANWEQLSIEKTVQFCEKFLQIPYPNTSQKLSRSWIRFFERQLRTMVLSLHQEQSQGVKVLTPHQASLLDFDYIFIPSMNEGIFPPRPVQLGLVPAKLRLAVGFSDPQAIQISYAYLLYRALQRTRRVYLTYHQGTTGNTGREKSRYLWQLAYETGLPYTHFRVKPTFIASSQSSIIIYKDQSILQQLDLFLAKHLSSKFLTPSSINTYLDCSLRFYFQYIAKLETPLPETSLIHPALFGQALHQVMEILYKKHKGDTITTKTITSLVKQVAKTLSKVLNSNPILTTSGYAKGTQGLIKGILTKLIYRLLDLDVEKTPFTLLDVELGYPDLMTTLSLANKKIVRLGGIIDRIDQKQDRIHIIDYKTGLFQPRIETIYDIFDAERPNRNKNALQILWYAWLYAQQSSLPVKPIQPTIISTRTLFDPNPVFWLSILEKKNSSYTPILDFRPYQKDFVQGLTRVLERLFDPVSPFRQTDDPARCLYCPYKAICHR